MSLQSVGQPVSEQALRQLLDARRFEPEDGWRFDDYVTPRLSVHAVIMALEYLRDNLHRMP